jgi:hypothetical protein
MPTIDTVTPDEAIDFGFNLLNTHRDKALFFEEAAQITAQEVFRSFQGLALVRIFRSCRGTEVPSAWKSKVNLSGNYMALAGTAGIEPSWNQRQTSHSYQLVDLGANTSPMFTLAMRELDIEFISEQGENSAFQPAVSVARYIYVPEAAGSPYFTHQSDFIQPYKIRSVVGIGTVFLSRAFYLMMCFSQRVIEPQTAENFVEIAPYVSTLLATFDNPSRLWVS